MALAIRGIDMRITCVCGRTTYLGLRICIWCGTKQVDCDFDKEKLKLIRKNTNK